MTAPIRNASRAVKAKPAAPALYTLSRQHSNARKAFTKPETAPLLRPPPSPADVICSLQSYLAEARLLNSKLSYRADKMIQDRTSWEYEVRHTDGGLNVYKDGKRVAHFQASYLRDRCPCPECVSPSSGNKSFSTGEIATCIRIRHAKVMRKGGAVRIVWETDIPRFAEAKHVSFFPATGPNSLANMAEEAATPYAPLGQPLSSLPVRPYYWNRYRIERQSQTMDYADFVAGGFKFQHAVFDLCRYGIVFLKNVPHTETAVADVALKFGAIKETFYGRTWDVVSKPDAENVAYTSSYLGLHSDMLYLESPPRIQLLHCLENSCSGGESLFGDALTATSILAFRDFSDFRALCAIKVPYHYSANGFLYRQERPVMVTNNNPDLLTTEVWWSPPFQAPFHRHDLLLEERDAWDRWHKAAAHFQSILENPTNVLIRRLQPGECVLFDNRRVLHGRRAFDANSGRRWLKGAYVANDDFTSVINNMARSSEFREYLRATKGQESDFLRESPLDREYLGATKRRQLHSPREGPLETERSEPSAITPPHPSTAQDSV